MSRKPLSEDRLPPAGRRLRQFREALGCNQEQFAEDLGLVRSQISDAERGASRITLNLVEALIRHSDISVRWLLIGKGPVRDTDPPRPVVVQAAAQPGEVAEAPATYGTASGLVAIPLVPDTLDHWPPTASDSLGSWSVIPGAWCPASAKLLAIQISGACPLTSLAPGAILCIDRSQTEPQALDGALVAVHRSMSHGIRVVRLEPDPSGLCIAQSPHAGYDAGPPVLALQSGADRIIGKVLTVQARVQ